MLDRTLDEFQVRDLIATGTAGKIYNAVEKKTGRCVALKILPVGISKDENIYIRFEREMVILGKLSHPNIVQYLGGGKDGDSLFYAMEKIEGGTLRQLIDRHRGLTWQETVTYAIRICSALQYLHNYGIIHRDLKPSNIFISLNGEIKLGDFGIAFDSGETELTESGLIVGSYAYMAPEQIRGDQRSDSRVDLYALGCVLYEMLCGHPPYQGDTFAKIFDQHLNSKIPDIRDTVSDTPTSLAKLIYHLMSKDRQHRPFNARAAQGVLSELKYRWEENEEFRQTEFERREEAFQKIDAPIEPNEISWKKIGVLIGIIFFIVAIAFILLGKS